MGKIIDRVRAREREARRKLRAMPLVEGEPASYGEAALRQMAAMQNAAPAMGWGSASQEALRPVAAEPEEAEPPRQVFIGQWFGFPFWR